MAAMVNGIALHGGFINYGATFLVFMEYARNAVRMAALMKIQSIFVFTHDSIGLGEDGPTHQPVEQLTMLRITPNMHTWRPCDTVESAVAWKSAIERRHGPSSLVFSRQNLQHQQRSSQQVDDIQRGGYVLKDCTGTPDAILIATGSEVQLAIGAAEKLTANGKQVRVVSMPCTEVFEEQDAAWREAVLPSEALARVAIEALHADFWYKYVGLDGRVVGNDNIWRVRADWRLLDAVFRVHRREWSKRLPSSKRSCCKAYWRCCGWLSMAMAGSVAASCVRCMRVAHQQRGGHRGGQRAGRCAHGVASHPLRLHARPLSDGTGRRRHAAARESAIRSNC